MKMKTKTNLKTLLVMAILLISMCLFNTNMVQATDNTVNAIETENTTKSATTDEKTTTDVAPNATETITDTTSNVPNADTLNNIDDEWTVTVKETQFKDLDYEKEILEPIKTILSNAGIDMTGYKLTCYFKSEINEITDIHKHIVSIEREEDNETIASKEITIQYSNSSNYNANDEKIVKEFANAYSDIWWAYDINETRPTQIEDDFKLAMNNLITDDSISFDFYFIGYGWYQYWTRTSDVQVFFFKNDICYVAKLCSYTSTYNITIPENIEDTEQAYINYALPKIKEKAGNNDIKLERQNSNSQWYNVLGKSSTGEYDDYDIIVMGKENTFMVYDGITISSNANVTLSVEQMKNTSSNYSEMQKFLKEKGYANIFNAYEIKLTSGNIGNGLTLTFELGTENNGKKVMMLHKKQDGKYEEFEKTVENGKISITVKELSPFMVGLKADNKVLDNEPKTRCSRLYNICKCNCSYFIRWTNYIKI